MWAFAAPLLGALRGVLAAAALVRRLLLCLRRGSHDAPCSLASDMWAYQMSIVRISANCAIASRYAVTDASAAARASAFEKPLLRAAIVKLAAMRLTSYSNGPGQRLVEVVQIEHQRALRRRVHTEVRQVRITTELHVEPRGRRVLQIDRHDLRRATIERERRNHHPPVPHRHQIGLPRRVLRFEQPNRIRPPDAGTQPSWLEGAAFSRAAFPFAVRSSILGCATTPIKPALVHREHSRHAIQFVAR